MSDNASSTILERFAPKAPPQPAVHERLYRAYGPEPAQKRQAKLQLRYQDGTLALLSYAYLMEVICTSHHYLSLIYTQCVITLEGRHLTPLIDLFQDDKIRWLQCFHATHFEAVPHGETVITTITRQSMKEFFEEMEG